MATASKVKQLLNCSQPVAEQLIANLYQWVTPDWSESSDEELRMDLLVAAECEGISLEAAT